MADKIEFLLIGGGLASAQAARSIREAGATGRVVIVGSEPELPYNRPPLSKGYLQGKEERDAIYVKPQDFWNEHQVELLAGRTAVSLDRVAHTVSLDDGTTLAYGKLLLATGSEPRTLNLPGASLKGIHYLRTVANSTAIREAAANAKSVLSVGGGFIGAEVAASLSMTGLDVTLLEGEAVLLGRQVGQAVGRYLTSYFKKKGVKIEPQAQVVEFTGSGQLAGVKLKDGREFSGDMAVVGVGVTPRTTLAGSAGLQVENGILVDSRFQTTDPDIYAAGDVANFVDVRLGRRMRIEHWDHAKASGKTAGQNLAGQGQPFEHLHYFYSDMFDLNLEAWGDMYQTDEVIEQAADSRAAGHPIWYYLYEGRLVAGLILNGEKNEVKSLQALLKGMPQATADLRQKLVDGPF